MANRKGIAIQVETHLLKKMDDVNLPRNDIINKALESYLTRETPKDHPSCKIEKEKKLSKNASEDLYNEIYSTMYNTEIIPLKNQLVQQRELIDILKEEIQEYRNDKTFLKKHIDHLFEQPPKKPLRFNKKRRQNEMVHFQEQDYIDDS